MIVVHIKKNNFTSIYQKGFCCEICDFGFLDSSEMLRHRKSLHDCMEIDYFDYQKSINLVSLCGSCRKFYKRAISGEHKCQQLEQQNSVIFLEKFDEEKLFFCDICGLRYGWICELRLHRENVHKDAATGWDEIENTKMPGVLCENCDKAFADENASIGHKCCLRGGKNEMEVDDYLNPPYDICILQNNSEKCVRARADVKNCELIPAECVYCNLKYFNKKQMLQHIKQVHDIELSTVYVCKLCQKSFKKQETLKWHNTTHHPKNENFLENENILNSAKTIVNDESAFYCAVCNRIIYDARGFLAHHRGHTAAKNFICDLCGFQTRTKPSIYKHITIVHLKLRSHVCDFCGKNFNRRADRDAHRRLHTGERPFSCEICGKTFSSMSHLLHHKRFHLDLRPYVCDTCPKSFKHKTSLTNHIRTTHTGEKPYVCELCTKSFSDGNRYRYHLRITHSDNRPFTCPICGNSFKANKFLTRHLKLHATKGNIQFRRRGKRSTMSSSIVIQPTPPPLSSEIYETSTTTIAEQPLQKTESQFFPITDQNDSFKNPNTSDDIPYYTILSGNSDFRYELASSFTSYMGD